MYNQAMPSVNDLRPDADTAALLEHLHASGMTLRADVLQAFAAYGIGENNLSGPLHDSDYFLPAAGGLTTLYAGICATIDRLPFFEKAFLCLGLYRDTALPDHENLLRRDTLGALYDFSQTLLSITDTMTHEDDATLLRRCFYAAAYDWTGKTISVCLRGEDSPLHDSDFGRHVDVIPLTPDDLNALSDSTRRLRDVFALADAPFKSVLNAELADAASNDANMPAQDIDTLMRRACGNNLREGAGVGGYIVAAAKAPWPHHAGAVICRFY